MHKAIKGSCWYRNISKEFCEGHGPKRLGFKFVQITVICDPGDITCTMKLTLCYVSVYNKIIPDSSY